MKALNRLGGCFLGGLAIGGVLGATVPIVTYQVNYVPIDSDLIHLVDESAISKTNTFINFYSKAFESKTSMISSTATKNGGYYPLEETFYTQKFSLSDEALSFGENQVFQNLLLSMTDSSLGLLADMYFDRKPVATAILETKNHAPLKPHCEYFVFATTKKVQGRRIFFHVKVTDKEGSSVADIRARFSKIAWTNAFKTK